MARFGSFEFDPDRRQLVSAGGEIHLTPKAFDLLALLIGAAPRVVSKREIHARLWPNGVVSDSNIVGLVKELRRALSDDDRHAPLIRTAYRVGYAFNAPIQWADPSAAAWRWLVVNERRLPLFSGENLIGRDPQCHIWLDFATVSRRHARIVVSGAGATLEDLGSKNGSRVGGARVRSPVRLRNGDGITFGQLRARYREAGAGFPTATQASWPSRHSSSIEP
jgi:DNA-binding winged helix-turn-helix (wHTH) protein